MFHGIHLWEIMISVFHGLLWTCEIWLLLRKPVMWYWGCKKCRNINLYPCSLKRSKDRLFFTCFLKMVLKLNWPKQQVRDTFCTKCLKSLPTLGVRDYLACMKALLELFLGERENQCNFLIFFPLSTKNMSIKFVRELRNLFSS